jgi:hypothetical protein
VLTVITSASDSPKRVAEISVLSFARPELSK